MNKMLEIGIIDLVSKKPTNKLFARIMNANFASIMPQVVGVWCEEEGHNVNYICYTGKEDLINDLPINADMVFICAFTESSLTAYALSNLLRSLGAVTVLGGPHARCYPEDAVKYFDYVVGFTDKKIIQEILYDRSPHRPMGLYLNAQNQPLSLPGVRERWKFIEPTLKKAPLIKMVPMLGSLGCPYKCSFCIDSTVAYQPLDFEILKEDLKFLLTKFRRPLVGWHDPNFGIRFDDYMNAIEEVIPENSIDFIAESSLSLLSEPHVKRLKKNGFGAMLPGIESWYDLGNKSKTGSTVGMDKVKLIADQINMILRYIRYVQTNFVLGLDTDIGEEPFELTKKFVDLTPGAFPGYSLLTAFGRAAPLNLKYQEENRVLPFPFHFLDNNQAMNIKPLNYSWTEFYSRVINLGEHTFAWDAIIKRMIATKAFIPRWMNLVRAISAEGFGRVAYNKVILKKLDSDIKFRSYFEQETTELPEFYSETIKKDLGPLWNKLPGGAIYHDQNAYMKSEIKRIAV
ncbi:MAG: radical SAM protein [Ignavibacteriales bacterium CG12_big_fil_rev_8_21_14_0_65_30_8]|nr:MAG: radical SAM protein [Ignavibacteriales bacterium CG12_big_fil_rev_8_21_14_0_65_30_8]